MDSFLLIFIGIGFTLYVIFRIERINRDEKRYDNQQKLNEDFEKRIKELEEKK